jgi:hypothetical protein
MIAPFRPYRIYVHVPTYKKERLNDLLLHEQMQEDDVAVNTKQRKLSNVRNEVGEGSKRGCKNTFWGFIKL